MFHCVENQFSGFSYNKSSYVEYSRPLVFYSFYNKKERDLFVENMNKDSKFLYKVPCTAVSGVLYNQLNKRKQMDLKEIEFCKQRDSQ